MAGTLFGLPLSVQIDANGDPLAGCKLYIYEAGTSTPATTYEDFGLTTGLELSFPIVADSSGRIPQFWVADGSYRARLVDAAGNEIFDLSSVTAIGASSGTSSGAGVSDTAIFQTGDFIWNPVSGARTGFVRANARTIGSSSSGGTERASSDCENLFLHLWTNYSDAIAPVAGGRGATAAADWAANKTIATPDMRGRAPFGQDDMGNSAAGVISGGTSVGAGGSATTTLVTGNLPAHTHGTGTYAVSSHTHTQQGSFASGANSVDHTHSYSGNTGSENQSHTHSGTTSSNGAHTHTYSKSNGTQGTTAGGSAVQDDAFVSDTTSSDGAHTHTITTGTESQSHIHGYSGTTGGTSGDHIHNVSISGETAATQPTLSGASGSAGSGTPATTISPYMLGTWYIKL